MGITICDTHLTRTVRYLSLTFEPVYSLIILFLIFGAMLMCALTYIVYIKNNIVGIKPRKKG